MVLMSTTACIEVVGVARPPETEVLMVQIELKLLGLQNVVRVHSARLLNGPATLTQPWISPMELVVAH